MSHRTNVLARVGLTALAVVSVAVLLSACGGGGGGGSPTPDPVVVTPPVTPPVAQATGTVKAEPASCYAQAGTGECSVPVTAKTENAPNGVLVTPVGQLSVANTTLTTPVAVRLGVSTLRVMEGTKELASTVVTATCVPTTVQDPVSNNCVGTPVLTLANETSSALEGTAPLSAKVTIEGFNVTGATALATVSCPGVTTPLMQAVTLPTSGGVIQFAPQTVWPASASCNYKLEFTATNLAGTATGSLQGAFTVPAAPPVVYYYTRVNIFTNGEVIANTGNGTLGVGYPQIISGTTVTPAKNETGFQVGLCALSRGKLPNGLPAAWCTKPSNGNVRAWFPIDPTRGVLMPEYTGDVTGMAYYAAPYGTFGDSPYVANGVSQSGMYIDVPGVGTYYYPDADTTQLRLTRDGFVTSELIKGGPINTLLMTYSNPGPNAN